MVRDGDAGAAWEGSRVGQQLRGQIQVKTVRGPRSGGHDGGDDGGHDDGGDAGGPGSHAQRIRWAGGNEQRGRLTVSWNEIQRTELGSQR